MTPQDAYRHLWHMFGAYFQQDWDMKGNDWPGLVRNYIADEPVGMSVTPPHL